VDDRDVIIVSEGVGPSNGVEKMRRLALICAFLIGLVYTSLAVAQEYVPALGDVMTAVQWRHIKLWFAGKLENWGLARHELRQIKPVLRKP
jgi:hypothetical protein